MRLSPKPNIQTRSNNQHFNPTLSPSLPTHLTGGCQPLTTMSGYPNYDPIAYISAHIALAAVLIPAAPVLRYLVARNVKAEGDSLRGGFKWLHAPLLCLFVTVVLLVANYAYILGVSLANPPVLLYGHFTHINRLGAVGGLFSLLIDITLVFCVSRLVSSVASAGAATPRRVYGYLVLSALGLSLAIYLAVFGFNIWSAENGPGGRSIMERFRIVRAFTVIRIVGAILVMLAAATVFVQAMQARKSAAATGMAWAARKLAIIAGLELFITVWLFVSTMVSLSGSIIGTHSVDVTGVSIASIIIMFWGSFGVMVMIYQLGKKREGGLWSDNRAKLERQSEEGATA
ncbi:hypothetical protein QBC39DRAFT_93062 [Podospora conica]|nr:hypothetical protein QBC39DRAFT_93062 [Schizothecium conicum]